MRTSNFESAIDTREFGGSCHLFLRTKTGKERLQDAEGHASQRCGGLIAVDSFVEIDLREGFHAPVLIDVEKVRGLYSVSHRKGNSLKHFTADGIFPAERLKQLGQFWIEE